MKRPLALISLAAMACAPGLEPDSTDAFGSADLTLAPPPGDLVLDVSDLRPGETVDFVAEGASPNAQVRFMLGFMSGQGPCPAPLGGLCLDIVGPKTLATTTADPSGIATTSFAIPASAPVDAVVHFQAVALGGSPEVSDVVTAPVLGPLVPDFFLTDENTNSPTAGEEVSPRDYTGMVSGWYFGHAT